MAEARVNVRLAAVGGLQVKAELEGIGDAASKGLGRVSSEVDRTNKKFAEFATKVKLAVAGIVSAFLTTGALMIRSSMQAIDAQAKLAQSLNTTVESIQILEHAAELAGVSFGELEQAANFLVRRLSDAAAGEKSVSAALARLRLGAEELLSLPLDERFAAIQEALRKYVPVAERAAVATQLFGDRTGLAILRIDTDTLRVAAKDVKDFGVTVSQVDAAQIEKANDAIATLGKAWQGFATTLTVAAAPAIKAVANFLTDLIRPTSLFGQAIQFVFDQMGRLLSYTLVFAGFFSARWIAALAAAAVAGFNLAKAIDAIKWAVTGLLSRGGPIGILLIVLGELTYQFLRLIDRVGSLEELFKRIGPLSAEIWERVKLSVQAMSASVTAAWLDLRAFFIEQMPVIVSHAKQIGQRITGAFRGAVEATKVVWSSMIDWFKWLFDLIRSNVLSSIEGIINGLIDRLNYAIDSINSGLQMLGMSPWLSRLSTVSFKPETPVDVKSIREAAEEARKVFWDEFYRNPPDLEKRPDQTAEALKLRDLADKYRRIATDLSKKIFAPFESLKDLPQKREEPDPLRRYGSVISDDTLNRLRQTNEQFDDIISKAGKLSSGDNKLLKGFAENLKRQYEEIRNTSRQIAEDITGPIKDALKSAELSWKSFSDTVVNIARNMVSRLIDAAFRPLENVLSGLFFQLFGNLKLTGGLPAAVAAAAGFARGGVFQGGRELQAFAGGGVISRPILFPLAGGMGLAGEAGPEAILPLRRGPGGRLGVEARGVSGTIFNVSIDARGADVGAAARLRAAIPDLARAIEGVARGEAARGLARA